MTFEGCLIIVDENQEYFKDKVKELINDFNVKK